MENIESIDSISDSNSQYEILSIETLDGTLVNDFLPVFQPQTFSTSALQFGHECLNALTTSPTLVKETKSSSSLFQHLSLPTLNSCTTFICTNCGYYSVIHCKDDPQHSSNHSYLLRDMRSLSNDDNNDQRQDNITINQNKESISIGDNSEIKNQFFCDHVVDLLVNIKVKKKSPNIQSFEEQVNQKNLKCIFSFVKMFSFFKCNNFSFNFLLKRSLIFALVLISSIIALVVLHNGSLHTRKAPTPQKFFVLNNPFIAEFEFGELSKLWARLAQNEIAFIMLYAPWDADCIRAKKEFEIVAYHYGQQIFFGAIDCWWPEGECRKYQHIKRFPYFIAFIRSEGEIEYRGPLLANYIIPFLDNVMNPLVPVQTEGELLDLRAKHDAVVLGYFNFQSPNQPGYRSYFATCIKALVNDPWRNVVYTVVTNSRTALKLKIDPSKESSLIIYVGNTSEHFTAKFSKPATILSWIYSRSELASTLKWITLSGIKSTKLFDFISKKPTFILFTPRSFLLGISPYYDLVREIVLDFFNCDKSPIVRSLIHRNILRRRLMEEKVSELEERCHELLDERELKNKNIKNFNNKEDTCCHTQSIKWRSFGGARRGMVKTCLCTSCVHISLPKCPAKCNHFDCLSTAARYLDGFDPNFINNSALHCNQINSVYEPKYTSYYKIETTCTGNLQAIDSRETNDEWFHLKQHDMTTTTDEKINRMIQDFEVQHCRRLKLGLNYTDLNFPENTESRKSNNWKANFTGLACRTNQTLKFMALDSLLYPSIAESLGIDFFNVPHSTIAVIVDPKKESIHVLDHEFFFEEVEISTFDLTTKIHVPINSYSKNVLIEFIKNYTDGTLPRFLRNQMISKSSGFCDMRQLIHFDKFKNTSIICVPELNSATFNQFILAKPSASDQIDVLKQRKSFSKKDILVMYYAPWCGFCTSIAHIYLDVARFYAFSNDILFTRINGDSNELPWEYTVDRYPTIIFFPANKRSNSVIYPPNKAISQIGLFEFILNHTQTSVKVHIMVQLCKRECLRKTLVSSYFREKSVVRALRHNLISLNLCRSLIKNFNSKSSEENSQKFLKKENLLRQHIKMHLIISIRKLLKIKKKQSLLYYFVLMRIDNLKISENLYKHKLSNELYSLLYKNVSNKKSTLNSESEKKISKKSWEQSTIRDIKDKQTQSKIKKILKDEL